MSSMNLTKEEKDILIELICNEQLKHMIVNDEYKTNKYSMLEQLKAKIKNV